MSDPPDEATNALFEQIRSDGFDPSQKMLWGYYFYADDPAPLRTLWSELELQGYSLGSIHPSDDGSHCLHVERIESHDEASLNARNAELDSLAARLGAEYDGMDVGPVMPPGNPRA